MGKSVINGKVCFFCRKPTSSVVGENAQLFLNCWSDFLSSTPQLTNNEFSQKCDKLRICDNCFETCSPFCDLYKEWKELERQLTLRLSKILEHVNNKFAAGTGASEHDSMSKLREELLHKSREKLDNQAVAASEMDITPRAEIKTEDNSSDFDEDPNTENSPWFSKLEVKEEQMGDDTKHSEEEDDDGSEKAVSDLEMEATSSENEDDSDYLLESDQDNASDGGDGDEPQRKKYRTNTRAHPCTAFNCQMGFQTASQLNTHLTHHGEFSCTFCTSTFTYAPQLSLHEAQKHGVTAKTLTKYGAQIRFQCARCPFAVSRDKKYVQHHLTQHLNLEVVSLQCPVCQLNVQNNKTLKKHLKVHQVEGLPASQIFTCSQCSALFNTTTSLTCHQSKVHIKHRNSCPTCGKTFTGSQNIRRHMKLAHPEQAPDLEQDFPFPCTTPNCGRRFHLEMLLQRHQKTCWGSAKIFACGECGMEYKKDKSLQTHIRRRHRERSHVCDECGDAFAFPSELQTHRNTRHNREGGSGLPCPQCGKVYPEKKRLNDHLRDVHGPRKHLCSDCGKSFKTAQVLESHRICVHGKGEKKFQCDTCGKRFITKVKLGIHTRSHKKKGG